MVDRPDTIQPRRDHLLEDVEPKLGNRKPEGMELPSTVTSHQQNIDLGYEHRERTEGTCVDHAEIGYNYPIAQRQ